MRYFCLILLAFAGTALADSSMPEPPLAYTQLANPKMEAKARELMLSIRCLVCQGQSIADSNAEMAGDMRALIRGRIQNGESPTAIRAWLIERYGSWVSYEPPFSGISAFIWVFPSLFLLAGAMLVKGQYRRRNR